MGGQNHQQGQGNMFARTQQLFHSESKQLQSKFANNYKKMVDHVNRFRNILLQQIKEKTFLEVCTALKAHKLKQKAGPLSDEQLFGKIVKATKKDTNLSELSM